MALNFQGILRDAAGKPLANGSYTMTFRLYTSLTATATAAIWTEQQTQVAVRDGRFSTTLGSVKPLLPGYFATGTRFIGVQVANQQEMLPRQRLGSVPYAVNADQLDGQDATFYARAGHKHSGADITTGQVSDARVANNLTISSGTITNTLINNSAIGQTTPMPGTFTTLRANTSLFAPNITMRSLAVTPAVNGITKPVVFRWFGPHAASGSAGASTGIPTSAYVCGISGFNTGIADINEGVAEGHEFLKVIAYAHTDGTWWYSAQVHTQNGGGYEEAKWQVGVMCTHRGMTDADAASAQPR
jgi:hypothetical protein